MSALAERPAEVATVIPLAPRRERRLHEDRLRIRREVALHVARVLLAEPEQFEYLTLADVLRQVPYVLPSHVRRICNYGPARNPRLASVDPLLLGSELDSDQRLYLANRLLAFAKDRL